ncbi:hypothetical protein Csa_017229 [Cucumis sativus]|uniref:SCP domain-containing protein n=1 Tax=Cucumis sativus TaxID=3659 RepID=A0A0A0K2V2_CUCSA|nr:hypothetical protein Csa_017229 [Cucumis sativus]
MSKMALATTLSALCIVALALTPIVIAQNSPQDFFDAHNALTLKIISRRRLKLNSFLVGCATVKCKNNWSLVSCNYSPSGNVVGERPY